MQSVRPFIATKLHEVPNSIILFFSLLFSVFSSSYLLWTAVSGNPTHACQLAMTLLRHPPCQVVLAAWMAALAGFTAWYFMWHSFLLQKQLMAVKELLQWCSCLKSYFMMHALWVKRHFMDVEILNAYSSVMLLKCFWTVLVLRTLMRVEHLRQSNQPREDLGQGGL